MFRPVRTVAPAVPLFDLPTVKLHLREDGTDQDTLITALIGAVTAQLDGYSGILGRCLVNQTWRQDYASFSSCLRLPFPDCSTATLKYYDTNNVQQTVAISSYQLLEDEIGSYIELSSVYTPPNPYQYRADVVSATFVAGYGADAAAVDGRIKAAGLLLIGNLYENREETVIGQIMELPAGARALLAPVSRKVF